MNEKTSRFRFETIAIQTLALSCVANFAAAGADPGADSSGQSAGLEEIIVTAQRAENTLQRVPIAVSAFSEKDLQERGVKNLEDVGNYTPSLVTGDRGGTGAAQGQISIRGIGDNAPDSAPSVGIYIDEVYYPSQYGSLLGLFDLQRVEVLRGPEGTLFGRNTIAGAIQYITVQPTTDKIGGYVEASGGTKDSYGFSGALNLPLADTLAVRVSAQKTENGGYVKDRLNDTELGRDTSKQARVQLRWMPTDKLTADVKLEGLETRDNGRASTVGAYNTGGALYLIATGDIPLLPPQFQITDHVPPAVDGPQSYSTAGYNAADFFVNHFNIVSGNIGYQVLDNLKIKSISAYSWTNSHLESDYDGTPLAIYSGNHGIDTIALFTQELQLSGSGFADRLHWTLGGFYYNSGENLSGYASVTALAPPAVEPTSQTDTVSKAGYGQATYTLIDGFSASAGVRYSVEDVGAEYQGAAGAPLIAPRRFKDTSPYYGLNWQIDDNTLIYVKASKGFRAGGLHLDTHYTVIPGNPNYGPGALYYGPETAWTYELGGRFTLLDRHLIVNPSIFDTDWKNIQFNNIDIIAGQGIAATRNAGDARVKGVELETQYLATERLRFDATYSYLDAYYTRLDPTLLIQSGFTIPVDLTLHDPVARAPRNKYSFGGQYKQPLADGSDAVVRLDYAYTSQQRSQTDGNQSEQIPSYGLLNARLEYHPADINLEIALYGTNLTNKYYLLDALNFQATEGDLSLFPGRPREAGISARYSF